MGARNLLAVLDGLAPTIFPVYAGDVAARSAIDEEVLRPVKGVEYVVAGAAGHPAGTVPAGRVIGARTDKDAIPPPLPRSPLTVMPCPLPRWSSPSPPETRRYRGRH
jgi:hypothetical protein